MKRDKPHTKKRLPPIRGKWTNKELRYLKKNYSYGDGKIMSEDLKKSWDAIQAKALRIGLRRKVRINIAEKNPNWKGGVQYQYYRRIAFENLPNECAVCGTTKRLEIHHKDKNNKNNLLSNLMILCNPHHKALHALMSGWSLEYDKCIVCGRDDIKHNARGMCVNCYEKIYYSKIRKNRTRMQMRTGQKYQPGTKRMHKKKTNKKVQRGTRYGKHKKK